MDILVTEKHLQQHYRMRSFKGECFWAHFVLFAIKREIQRALSEVTSLRNACRLASATNPENIAYTRLWTMSHWYCPPPKTRLHIIPPVPTIRFYMYTLLGGATFSGQCSYLAKQVIA